MPPLLLLIAYPVLVHIAIITTNAWVEWAALTLVAAALLGKPLHRREWLPWMAFVLIAAVCALLANSHWGQILFLLPPVIFPLLTAAVFGVSLRPGHTALVTDMAQSVHGSLSPELLRYTRAVTWLWALVLTAMTVWDILLPLYATPSLWSAVTNFANYVFIAAVFLGEYGIRRLRFPRLQHPPFADYLRLVVDNRPTRLR